MCITGFPKSPEVGIWEMREVIQIADTKKELRNKNKRFVGQQ